MEGTGAQLSLLHPDLVPGGVVRVASPDGWHFGTLEALEGGRAVVRVGREGRRVSVPLARVRPWPPSRPGGT